METQSESLWLLALSSNCTSLSPQTILLLFFFLCLTWLALVLLYWAEPGGPAWGKYRHKLGPRTTPVPPGPRGYPFIGSMDLMMGLAHHKLTSMANRLGARRLMAFSLGGTRVVITCSHDVAKEILCSSVFADRPIKESAYNLMFNRAMGFAPYGVYWRMLRRIAATHMFSPKQISHGQRQRAEIASQMVEITKNNVGCNGQGMSPFCVREMLKLASLTNMMESVFGRRYELAAASLDKEAAELSQLVQEGYELLGKLNWSDHFPLFSSLDLQRIRERCSGLVPRVNRFVNRIISEHRLRNDKQEAGNSRGQDFVDVLLSLDGPDKLSDADMVAVLWEMIFRGTDTVAVLIEWILARMVLHPDIQSKVQNELDKVVGKSRPLMESDIPSLGYLQAVVKEVLRLHPPGPLLSWARLAITDTNLDGYHIPAGTTAMVNMWAIARDPKIWTDPLRFYPERFVDNVDFSVLGSDLRLAPFGSGRRSCPGKALGLATVSYWVGTLLHEFVWTQCDHNPVTLNEVMKLSCEMANPLTAMVYSRRR